MSCRGLIMLCGCSSASGVCTRHCIELGNLKKDARKVRLERRWWF